MKETLVSPGVLAIENDQSFITEQPIQAGAAIMGPTVKGPVGIPTICTTYSDYQNKFGSTFITGGIVRSYLTSVSVYNYFQQGGTSMLVTRIVSGTFLPATSSTIPTSIGITSASATMSISPFHPSGSFSVNGITLSITGSAGGTNTSTIIYVPSGSSAANTAISASTYFNASSSVAPYSSSLYLISSSASSTNIIFTYTGSNSVAGNSNSFVSGGITYNFTGGTNSEAFIIETLSEGEIMNSSGSLSSNGMLSRGTADNFRWQIVSPNTQSGTFSLLVRQGNDLTLSPSILERWDNLSLDPTEPNYIEKIIGNSKPSIAVDDGEYYVKQSGAYTNNSKYIRVKSVLTPTTHYLDNNSQPKSNLTSSIPFSSNGVFDGATGNMTSSAHNYNENITDSDSQGLSASDYTNTINLLSNKDAYKYNFITVPGLINSAAFPNHTSTITTLISNIQNRGDSFVVMDSSTYGDSANVPITTAASRDTSYAATYYPWILTLDPSTAQQIWVPPSTMIPAVYAFNDAVADPWIAPAGVNRGVMTTAVRTERYISQNTRDSLYQAKVNPIATFQNSGVTVFGQKTLQTRRSALDRINVRRLLIELKSFIVQVADTLVFEPNNEVTRNNFLSQVNPYLSSVQQREGLTDYKVIMDESNNNQTTIDNNELIGAIYIQPTRTAEYIILDFNVLPTGATFPS